MFHKVVSVATCKCGVNNRFTAYLPKNLPVKKFSKSVNIW